ncbi:MAG: response regulator [Pseudomonadota bacterium]
MSQFSIFARLVFLCVVLLGILVASNIYFSDELSRNAKSFRQETELVSVLKSANSAVKAFGDLKHWLTDLAVSLLVLSEQNAYQARDALYGELENLEFYDPDTGALIRQEVDALIAKSIMAVEAYSEDQRVLGNALMAEARGHITVVDQRLSGLVDRLEAESVRKSQMALNSVERAADLSLTIVVLAVVIGILVPIIVLSSITVPLRKLVAAMSSITSGKLDVEIPAGGKDEIGAMARTLSLFRDSLKERDRLESERLKAEAARQRAQIQLTEAIEAISEGFALYDPDDRLVVCNEKFRELYAGLDMTIEPGTTYEAIIKQAVDRKVIADAEEQPEIWLEERLERHRHPSGTHEQRRSDGRFLRISERPTDEGGVVGVFHDITELKRREAQLEQAVENLAKARDLAAQATVAKSQFLANMSHELRTPLNAVIGITEMLQEDAEDAGQEDFIEPLQRVSGAGNHLLHLINEILDLSKIESGKMELYLEEIDLAALLEEVKSTAQPLAEKNDNRLSLESLGELGTIYADRTRLRQIVLNLLSNACKFTTGGQVAIRASRLDDKEVTITVNDTGIGMTEDQIGRLFQEFSQADNSTTRKYGGTGLGLAISQRLCHLMGGDIGVTSIPEVGTTFTVKLPTRVEEQQRDLDVLEQAAQEPIVSLDSGDAAPQPRTGRNDTVLVVDDDPVVLDMMRRLLAKEGFDVVTANDGREGLELAREFMPSVITLDVLMPRFDGWCVLREIKTDPELAHIPIIMVTILDEKKKGFALGATDYLTKPVDRKKLGGILSKYRNCGRSNRILIVEDDEPTRSLMARSLAGEDWEVVEAENGRVALERLAETMPDLILLDLMMPEMDGFDFIAALRKMPAMKDVPVVVVTAAELTEEDHRRLNGGVERVLQKSAFDRDALLEELCQSVARYATRQDPEGPEGEQ